MPAMSNEPVTTDCFCVYFEHTVFGIAINIKQCSSSVIQSKGPTLAKFKMQGKTNDGMHA